MSDFGAYCRACGQQLRCANCKAEGRNCACKECYNEQVAQRKAAKLTTDQPASEAGRVFWTGLVRREVYRLERERDEARDVARVFQMALRGDRVAAAIVASCEDRYPWLTTDQPASEAEEEGEG